MRFVKLGLIQKKIIKFFYWNTQFFEHYPIFSLKTTEAIKQWITPENKIAMAYEKDEDKGLLIILRVLSNICFSSDVIAPFLLISSWTCTWNVTSLNFFVSSLKE